MEKQSGALVVDNMQSMPGVDYESMLSDLGQFGASFTLATSASRSFLITYSGVCFRLAICNPSFGPVSNIYPGPGFGGQVNRARRLRPPVRRGHRPRASP